MIYYNLAYGSNMSLNRLLARLPNATRIGVSTVTGFTLTFDKQGFDGSGKCNALKPIITMMCYTVCCIKLTVMKKRFLMK